MKKTFFLVLLLVGVVQFTNAFGNEASAAVIRDIPRSGRQASTAPTALATVGPFGIIRSQIPTPMLYPDDSNTHARRLPFTRIAARYHFNSRKSGLYIGSVKLTKYNETDLVKEHILNLRFIHPNHVVYEMMSYFNTDQEANGNHWSSGERTFIIDAETGSVIAIQTKGLMTVNSGLIRASRHRPVTQLFK